MRRIRILAICLMALLAAPGLKAEAFKNFKVAVYCRAYEVARMGDLEWLDHSGKTSPNRSMWTGSIWKHTAIC